MAPSKKVKVLLVGSIGENANHFVQKITSLQNGKAGPFHACFCVGKVSYQRIVESENPLPMPVYLQDSSSVSIPSSIAAADAAKEEDTKNSSAEQEASDEETTSTLGGIVGLPSKKNLFVLMGATRASKSNNQEEDSSRNSKEVLVAANIWNVPVGSTTLVVASCPPHGRLDSDTTKPLRDKLQHASYVGCDLLLTSEWPQGMDAFLANKDDTGAAVVGSYDVAELALRARPRYHIVPHSLYQQSDPFSHLASSTSTFVPKHVGRFLALAPVDPTVAKADRKRKKFVHALGLTPLHEMTATELQESSSSTAVRACPYTDESYQKDGTSQSNRTVGLSEGHARRLMTEEQDNHRGYRWQQKKNQGKRRFNSDFDDNDDDNNVDNQTLYVGGLQNDLSGQLQNGIVLLQALAQDGASKVRRPTDAPYAFVDFRSHESARVCLERTGGQIEVAHVVLHLKWAKNNNHKQKKKPRLMEADAMDSSSLYFRMNLNEDEGESVPEELRQLMEKTLEAALADPNVTAANEPALRVKLRYTDATKGFGFLDFASHAAASMALASLTGSTDGGTLVPTDGDNDSDNAPPPRLVGTVLQWALATSSSNQDGQIMETASGIKFQRKHFPKDSRTDCWFCLASPTCEKHLITSVHNECYMTLPKGQIHPGHVLLVPVTHSSTGALSVPDVADEMERLKEGLRRHAAAQYDGSELFCFERAIQTKGGYHTHVQCVPVPPGSGPKLQATMLHMAKKDFALRPVNSDIPLSSLTADHEEGYFYAEVPISTKEYKRFLYRATDGTRNAHIPLQFGREVLASVLDNPDLAHWKACVVDEEQETKLATAFRESFTPYEPSS